MERDPGAPDDKGKNEDLPPTDEIPVPIDPYPKGMICSSGPSRRLGPSNNISDDVCSTILDSPIKLTRKQKDESMLFAEWFCRQKLRPEELRREELRREELRQQELRRQELLWQELRRQELRRQELHRQKLWKELQADLRGRELRRQELRGRQLRREELHQEELHWKKLWEELCGRELRQEVLLQKLISERFVQGTSSATGKISVLSSISHYSFPHSGTSSAMGKRIVEGLDMCMTCKQQFPHSERFCSYQHKLTPITAKARPRWNASSEGTITMHNPRSSDEVNGFARENVDIKTGPGPTLRPPVPILTKPNMWDEINSEPSQASDSFSSHGFAGFAGKDSDIEMGLGHTVHPPVQIVTMPNVSDETTSEPSQASDSFSSHGFAGNDSGIKMVLGHTLCHPAPISTMPNVSDETTLEPSQASDSSSSHDFSPTDRDIERGRTHSSDLVPSEPRLGDFCSYHHAYEHNWQRLSTVVDLLLAGIIQIGCSLMAFETSDGSSPARDVLFYLLVIICVLGFLYTLAGKLFHCAKMAVIGLVATTLGFLMTMALVVIYKIR